MSVKKVIAWSVALLICAVFFISPAFASKTDDQLSVILDGVLKRYGELKGLSVPYKREIITKSMALLGNVAKADGATGKIIFKTPYYLAIEQATPDRETITTDGQTAWYFIEAKKTVYEYPVDQMGKYIKLFSAIFSGLSKVGDSFDVMQSDPGDMKEYHLKLVPYPSWEEVDYINLLVDRDNFNVRVVEIHDLLGTTTRFTLDEFSVRKDLKNEYFKFKADSGVKIIKEGQE